MQILQQYIKEEARTYTSSTESQGTHPLSSAPLSSPGNLGKDTDGNG